MIDGVVITAAGREVPSALDRIRRYCGLTWSGGSDETWAWRYYDAVPTLAVDEISPVDVLAAGALHPGLGRADLDFFHRHRHDLGRWLRDLPTGVRLWQVDEVTVDHVAGLPEAFPGVSLTLLAKVIHRKRPHLVPPLDRHVVDWYRPVTGRRAVGDAWGPIVTTMHLEERDEERRGRLARVEAVLAAELPADPSSSKRPQVSWLRLVDIAIWMGSR